MPRGRGSVWPKSTMSRPPHEGCTPFHCSPLMNLPLLFTCKYLTIQSQITSPQPLLAWYLVKIPLFSRVSLCRYSCWKRGCYDENFISPFLEFANNMTKTLKNNKSILLQQCPSMYQRAISHWQLETTNMPCYASSEKKQLFHQVANQGHVVGFKLLHNNSVINTTHNHDLLQLDTVEHCQNCIRRV